MSRSRSILTRLASEEGTPALSRAMARASCSPMPFSSPCPPGGAEEWSEGAAVCPPEGAAEASDLAPPSWLQEDAGPPEEAPAGEAGGVWPQPARAASRAAAARERGKARFIRAALLFDGVRRGPDTSILAARPKKCNRRTRPRFRLRPAAEVLQNIFQEIRRAA